MYRVSWSVRDAAKVVPHLASVSDGDVEERKKLARAGFIELYEREDAAALVELLERAGITHTFKDSEQAAKTKKRQPRSETVTRLPQPEVVPVTLSTIAEGVAEDRFQEGLHAIRGEFSASDIRESSKGTITIRLDVTKLSGTELLVVSVADVRTGLPRRKAKARPVHFVNDLPFMDADVVDDVGTRRLPFTE